MQGYTALVEAARHGHTEIVQILLNADADADSKDKYVSTDDGSVCLSGADLVVCGAGQDCAGPCKAVQSHTNRPTTYKVNTAIQL